ncbi:MAG: hypothetical protein OXH79_16835 [Boseongicola sp.]|nr:hypothetical protein [Boseongicola sp.]
MGLQVPVAIWFQSRLWEGVRFLSHAVIAIRAMQERDGSKSEGEEETDSSVLD